MEGRWRLGGMLWQHFSSLPRDIEYQAGEKQHKKWGTMSRQLTFGEKILSAKGMSCPGHNSTARHCLRTLSLAQQDSQHPPRMKIQPAAACPGQVPRHAQPCPCPPTTCWQLDSGLRVGAISAGFQAMQIPHWGQPHACRWDAPHCTRPAAGGQTGTGLAKICPSAHEVSF